MTITADELKKALAPITSIDKKTSVDLDLGKVAGALVRETTEFVSGEDPMSKLDALCTRVDGIDALLSKATSDDKGNVTLLASPDDAIAKEFSVDPAPATPAPAATPAATDPAATTAAPAATTTEKGDDLSDDVVWEKDLSFATPPTSRRARMTKGERPVPARPGAHKSMRQFEEVRAEAREGQAGDDDASTSD